MVVGVKKFFTWSGAFDETISKLDSTGLGGVRCESQIKSSDYRICVGMQILAESSEEGLLQWIGHIKGKLKDRCFYRKNQDYHI
jgi:imidazoleglycerol phosphate synthase glutamine amidotransferase subunit HisH